ncbi:ribonuclease H1 [Platysternon megacephalum]|uniref:Ribonuclease H1 n=1 Tax=Platysternon megacephalum TaxID=55544 RepID=A0A4D9F1I9_9SAUR|nr:ribonuclease H1 [Platysternon megacephalum]
MGETEQRPTAGSRLGAQENAGISTLEHGQKLPMTPPGKLISIKIQMLDDTQEVFDVPEDLCSGFTPMSSFTSGLKKFPMHISPEKDLKQNRET